MSKPKQTTCPSHGQQGIGLLCTHLAHAIATGELVGFFWGDDEDLARPDAWCKACNDKLLALDGASSEQWFVDADFKTVCAACWDDAKAACGGLAN